MQSTRQVPRSGATRPALARDWALRAHALDELPSDRIFVEMLTAYRRSGGIGRLDALTRLARHRGEEALPSVLSLPNCWLKDQRPVDLLDSQQALVLAAARVDRFIANG